MVKKFVYLTDKLVVFITKYLILNYEYILNSTNEKEMFCLNKP